MQKRHETGYDVYSPKDVKNDKRKKKQEWHVPLSCSIRNLTAMAR